MRPLLPREVASGARPCLELGGIIGGRPDVRLNDKSFSFDGVFGPGTEEEKLYQRAVSPLVEQSICGLNATVLACKRATGRQIIWQNPTENVTTRPHLLGATHTGQNIMIPQGYSPSLPYVCSGWYFQYLKTARQAAAKPLRWGHPMFHPLAVIQLLLL